MAVFQVAIPTVLGASLALFGVWLTNRNNRKSNEDNRRHDIEKWQKQRHFELTKEFYYEVVKSSHHLKKCLMTYRVARAVVSQYQSNETDSLGPEASVAYVKGIYEAAKSASESLEAATVAFSQAIAPGWILLPKDRFQPFAQVNNMIARVSLDVHNVTRNDEIPPSLLELELVFAQLVECAKADLGYS